MSIEKELHKAHLFTNIELLAQQVVEGYISGLHKSPFHGFAAEFAEHKMYNKGESTKHIDWKLYAKTDKLYTKKYEEETNLRCHLIIDNSSSMHYPQTSSLSLENLNKVGFSVLAAAAVMNMLKKQRDAVGLSIYSNTYEYYRRDKSSDRHFRMLLAQLNGISQPEQSQKTTDTYTYLHQIAENIHRRSMIFLFTDLFQAGLEQEQLFEALQHLKYNKHEVILFHVIDKNTEVDFNYHNSPKRFVDIETQKHIDIYPENIQESYQKEVKKFFNDIKLKCAQYKIKYVEANITEGFEKILNTYLIERQKFK